jgi:hypothetical protein
MKNPPLGSNEPEEEEEEEEEEENVTGLVWEGGESTRIWILEWA